MAYKKLVPEAKQAMENFKNEILMLDRYGEKQSGPAGQQPLDL